MRVAAVILTRDGELRATIAELTEEVRPVATEGTLTDAVRRYIMATLGETNWVLGGPNGAAAGSALTERLSFPKCENSVSHGRRLESGRRASRSLRRRPDLNGPAIAHEALDGE